MMTAAQGAAQIWPDVLCCLGQGLLVACLYDAARSVLGRARLTLFVLDLAGFLLAGLMVFSYGASRSWGIWSNYLYHLVYKLAVKINNNYSCLNR